MSSQKTSFLIKVPNLLRGYGPFSSRGSMSMSVWPQAIIPSPMVKLNTSIRSSPVTSDHIVTANIFCSGQNMHKTLFVSPPLNWLHFTASWDINPIGWENLRIYLQLMNGCRGVRLYGMRHIYKGLLGARRNKRIALVATILIIAPDNGCGSRLGICISGYLARNSVLGTWLSSK